MEKLRITTSWNEPVLKYFKFNFAKVSLKLTGRRLLHYQRTRVTTVIVLNSKYLILEESNIELTAGVSWWRIQCTRCNFKTWHAVCNFSCAIPYIGDVAVNCHLHLTSTDLISWTLLCREPIDYASIHSLWVGSDHSFQKWVHIHHIVYLFYSHITLQCILVLLHFFLSLIDVLRCVQI